MSPLGAGVIRNRQWGASVITVTIGLGCGGGEKRERGPSVLSWWLHGDHGKQSGSKKKNKHSTRGEKK